MRAIGDDTPPCLPKAMVLPEADPASLGAITAGESAATVCRLHRHPCPAPDAGWEGSPSAVCADRSRVPFLLLGGGTLGRCPFFVLQSAPQFLQLSCGVGMSEVFHQFN